MTGESVVRGTVVEAGESTDDIDTKTPDTVTTDGTEPRDPRDGHSGNGDDTPTRHWNPDIDARMAAYEPSVEDVLSPTLDALSTTNPGRITLVPDMHYPFHPSTGMVTDPALVGATLSLLDDRTDAELAVAGTSSATITFERTTDYLGYPSLVARTGAELVDCSDDDLERERYVLTNDDHAVAVSVPVRLRESAVITVPTLRPTDAGAFAGGRRTLARLVDAVADAAATAVAATRAIDPRGSLLDATTAYGESPYAANTLFAGPTPAVDTLGASLLGRSSTADRTSAAELEAMGAADSDSELSTVRVTPIGTAADASDVDFEQHLATLRERLDGASLPPSDATHPAVSAAYRLYAAVGGDAVPPQLDARGGH
ncbi:hypothetical protein [Natrialba taiwanensis]|uniref:DUF362 domain-containing protein n=1 Tax=Natrialba taiwanensis DSM 12281 TaxID=1230458 RepID=L9ZEQ1_9EURY|nr:hypothetical protein [Natrialba taiwanensis]ELY84844.1 hypothetical protein C484_21893 [Natrialba taiwanensis DSM 12281]